MCVCVVVSVCGGECVYYRLSLSYSQSDMFQEDIFPPCSAGTAALSVEDWMSGINKDPCLLKFTRDALVEMESEQAVR